jgi:hypothetical protein
MMLGKEEEPIRELFVKFSHEGTNIRHLKQFKQNVIVAVKRGVKEPLEVVAVARSLDPVRKLRSFVFSRSISRAYVASADAASITCIGSFPSMQRQNSFTLYSGLTNLVISGNPSLAARQSLSPSRVFPVCFG